MVVSKPIIDHVEHLSKVLQKLKEANLKLKLQKCKFAQQRTEYLGQALIVEGVSPNVGKVQAGREFLRPQTMKGV